MGRRRSARLVGLKDSALLIAPVAAYMLYRHEWSWYNLTFAVLLSVPLYFLARNRILLEDHPGFRGGD